jgi:hypothetical protein
VRSWEEFVAVAPRIAEIFLRRYEAAHSLCMLGTLRVDGFPRISPMEPRFFEGQLWLAGMPGTAKFRDLARDPKFSLHTATIDPEVNDGDAKVWGVVEDVRDATLHQRYTEVLFEATGLDVRGQELEHLFAARIVGAAAVEVGGGHLDITLWNDGSSERVVRKH